jgi:hypothetical protein
VTEAKASKYVTTHHVTLGVYEGVPGQLDAILTPPGEVLKVAVVGDRAFIYVCEYHETHDTETTKVKAEVCVDASALLNALVAQMDVERSRIIPLPFEATP